MSLKVTDELVKSSSIHFPALTSPEHHHSSSGIAAMHIEKLQVHIPLTDVSENKVGIDFDHELVKICYIAKSETEESKKSVEFLLFDPTHIREALQHVASHANQPVDLHTTGTVTEKIKQMLKEELKVEEVHHVNATDAEVKGHFALLRECTEEDLVFPGQLQPRAYGQVVMSELHSEVFANMRRQIHAGRSETSRFPCVVASLGSRATFTRLNEDGSHKVLYVSPMSAGSFNFLSSALLGIHEDRLRAVSDLSREGNRIHVDTQAGDMFSADSGEYGRLPPEMPMFAFGKLADNTEMHLETLKQEDVAHAIFGLFGYSWYFEMFGAALGEGVPMLYICGSLLREKAMREELYYSARCWAMPMLEDIYYRTGLYAAALGCLLQ